MGGAEAAHTMGRMSSRARVSPPPPDLRRAYERNLRVYYVFKLLSEMWLLIPIFVAFLLLDRGLSVGPGRPHRVALLAHGDAGGSAGRAPSPTAGGGACRCSWAR